MHQNTLQVVVVALLCFFAFTRLAIQLGCHETANTFVLFFDLKRPSHLLLSTLVEVGRFRLLTPNTDNKANKSILTYPNLFIFGTQQHTPRLYEAGHLHVGFLLDSAVPARADPKQLPRCAPVPTTGRPTAGLCPGTCQNDETGSQRRCQHGIGHHKSH